MYSFPTKSSKTEHYKLRKGRSYGRAVVLDRTAVPNKVAAERIFRSVALTCNLLPPGTSSFGTLTAGRLRGVFPFPSSGICTT